MSSIQKPSPRYFKWNELRYRHCSDIEAHSDRNYILKSSEAGRDQLLEALIRIVSELVEIEEERQRK